MPRETGKKRPRLSERLYRALDIQPDALPSSTLIELRGRNLLTVRGGGKITSYTQSEIRIAVKGGELKIVGERLFCAAYHRGAAVIDGEIRGLEFTEGGET